MKGFKLKLRLILLSLSFILGVNIYAASNAKIPYILINLSSDNIIMLALNEEFKIDNIGKEIKIYITENPTYIALEDIKSLGFLYANSAISSIDSIESETEQPWMIYDSSGRLIKQLIATKPDLTGLKAGEVYIVKTVGKAFKYMPYK